MNIKYLEFQQACAQNNTEYAVQLMLEEEVIEGINERHPHALGLAAQYDNLTIINKLLAEPFNLDPAAGSKTFKGSENHALIIAMREGKLDVVNRLLEEPSVLNAIKATCLRLARKLNDAGIEARLLETPNLLKYKQFLEAIRNNNQTQALQLMDEKEVSQAIDEDNPKALAVAAKYGNTTIINRLLADPFKLYAAAEDNLALGCAVLNNKLDVVNILLDNTSVLEMATFNNNEILELAIMHNYQDIRDRLLQVPSVLAESLKDQFLHAAQSGYLEFINRFLNIPISAKFKGVYLDAFKLATENNQLEVKDRLLQNPFVLASSLKPELLEAVRNGDLKFVNRFLDISVQAGMIDFSFCGKENWFEPIELAAEYGQVEVFERLSSIRHMFLNADKLMEIAIKNNHLPIVNKILEKDPDILTRSLPYMPEFIYVPLECGHINIVNRFLEFSDVTNFFASKGAYSSLQGPIQKGRIEVVNRLLEIPEIMNSVSILNLIDAVKFYNGSMNIIDRLLLIPTVLPSVLTEKNVYDLLKYSIYRYEGIKLVTRLLAVDAFLAAKHFIEDFLLKSLGNGGLIDPAILYALVKKVWPEGFGSIENPELKQLLQPLLRQAVDERVELALLYKHHMCAFSKGFKGLPLEGRGLIGKLIYANTEKAPNFSDVNEELLAKLYNIRPNAAQPLSEVIAWHDAQQASKTDSLRSSNKHLLKF